MKRPDAFPLPLQVLLWAVSNTTAGAAIGVAVGAVRPEGFQPTILWISILFANVVGFTVLTSSLLLIPRLRGVAPVVRAVAIGLALLAGSVAGTVLVVYLFPLFVLRDLRQTVAVAVINGILALVVGGTVHAYEALRWRLAESLREVEEVRLVEAKLREHAARAEVASLQARIHPHFFFNTLNTISSLLEEDAAGAGEVVQRLADLFRYTFRAAETVSVSLADELDFVEGYLAIEKARFGDRLRIVVETEPAARSVRVPGLILQPLVENAVGHGIAPLAEGGTVWIRSHVRNATLRLEVEDDGAGLASGDSDWIREGHGLANVRDRLRTLYAEQGMLDLAPGRGGRGAVASIALPVAGGPHSAPAVAGTAERPSRAAGSGR